MKDVVVVGGGASGVAVAFHLLRRAGPDLRVALVERGPRLGRGVAYAFEDPVFRLNVPASRMSIDPARPGDFVEWAGAAATPDAFLPRATFGGYVEARLREADAARPGVLRVVQGDVVDVDERSVVVASAQVRERLPADAVVLATGIEPRLAPSPLPPDPRIVDAWDEPALESLPAAGHVLVLGAGLTALDVVAWLAARAFTGSVTILSRRGLLPRPHLVPLRAATPLPAAVVDGAPSDLRRLLGWVRRIVRDEARRGQPWQLTLDALRPHVPRLYRRLPDRDRARFVRSVRPYWDVLRHRAPPDALALVDAWRAADRLEVLAGRVAACHPGPDDVTADLVLAREPPRRERFARIVRCLGPALERSEAEAPLVRALVARGLAAADPAGLGIVTDEDGRVVTPSGSPSDRLFAIGALRRASSWETTSIPDIALHAQALSLRIAP